MKIKSEIVQSWECPKCKRHFKRKGQMHSCKIFPIAQHFQKKEKGKELYDRLRWILKEKLGDFTIDSLECCIHFVNAFTFAAVKIFKDKIRVDFSLDEKVTSAKIKQSLQLSAHRYLYCIDIFNENEIDDELLQWITKAYKKES